MSFRYLKLDRHEDVTVMTLHHGEENNVNADVLREWIAALQQLEEDDETRAVVVTGNAEKYWSTGIDLKWYLSVDKAAQADFMKQITEMTLHTLTLKTPMIAAINGHCFGLGAIWSCAFDFRLMREDRGWFCFPEVDVNVPLAPGMIELISQTLPFSTYNRLLLTGQRVSGQDAVRLKIVDAAYPQDQLLDQAIQHARIVGGKQPDIYGSLKRSIRGPVIAAYEAALKGMD